MEQQNNIDKPSLVKLRMMNNDDKAFIFSTWLKGLKFGNSWYKLIDDKVYYKVYHRVIEAILEKPSISVRVACLIDAPEVILGYAVFEHDRLHWVQVKKAWRRIGLAKDLVPTKISSVSHLTAIGKIIFLKHNMTFNPFEIL